MSNEAQARPASIGDNGGPPLNTPFDAIKAHVDDLMVEAGNWLDGEPIENDAQAEAVGRLLEELRLANKAADDARKTEGEPHRQKWVAVNDAYKPLTDRLAKAQTAAKALIGGWLRKQEEARKAEADRLAKEAAEKAAAAVEQVREAAGSSDLDSIEEAERALRDAKRTAKEAARVGNSKASVSGGARAVTMRRRRVARIEDLREACRHYWQANPEAFRATIQALADADCRAGVEVKVPGIRWDIEETVA